MFNPQIFAITFARAVALLRESPPNKGQQKAALRAIYALTSLASATVRLYGGVLSVDDVVVSGHVPSEDLLAGQMEGHGIAEIAIARGAAPAELLALLRALAADVGSYAEGDGVARRVAEAGASSIAVLGVRAESAGPGARAPSVTQAFELADVEAALRAAGGPETPTASDTAEPVGEPAPAEDAVPFEAPALVAKAVPFAAPAPAAAPGSAGTGLNAMQSLELEFARLRALAAEVGSLAEVEGVRSPVAESEAAPPPVGEPDVPAVSETEEPVALVESAPVEEQAPVEEVAPGEEPVPLAELGVEEELSPFDEPVPMVELGAGVELSPVEETVLLEEQYAAEELSPFEEPVPLAEQDAAVEELSPVDEAVPLAEQDAVAEPSPVEEPALVAEQDAAAEPSPVEEPALVAEQDAAVEEPSPVEEAVPQAEQDAVAEPVPVVELGPALEPVPVTTSGSAPMRADELQALVAELAGSIGGSKARDAAAAEPAEPVSAPQEDQPPGAAAPAPAGTPPEGAPPRSTAPSVAEPVRPSPGVEVAGVVARPAEPVAETLDGALAAVMSDPYGTDIRDALTRLRPLITDAFQAGRAREAAGALAAVIGLEPAAPDAGVKESYAAVIRTMLTKDALRRVAALAVDPGLAPIAMAVLPRGGTGAVDVVAELVAEAASLEERRGFLAALRRLPQGMAAVSRLLASNNVAMVRDVAELAGELRIDVAVPALAKLMGHHEPRVRLAAVVALSRIGSTAAVELLRRTLSDGTRETRLLVASGIGSPHARALTAPLVALAQSEADPVVQVEYYRALGRIGAPEAVAALAEAAQPGGRLFHRRPAARRIAAVEGLKVAFDPAARRALEALRGDADAEVRDAVTRALSLLVGRAATRAP